MSIYTSYQAHQDSIASAKAFDGWNALQDKSKDKGRARGLAFVSLFASAKQLVDNFPGRFPYLEYHVKDIEKNGLAPALEVKR